MEDDRNPPLNHEGIVPPPPPPPQDGLALNRANERVVPLPERRTLVEFFLPNVDNANYGCFAPPILANNFEIKPGTIQLLESRCQFYGLEREDPNAHLSKFTELRLFPSSLRDKARNWIQSLPSTSITTWKQLAQAFLNKYLSMGKTARMTKEIIDFLQLHGESLYQAWERFKELQRNCPHHHLGREHLVSIFYNGTNEGTRATIDAASGGSLMKKTYDEANNFLEELATNSCSWSTERMRQPPQKGIMTLEQTQEFEAMKGMDCPVLHQNSNEQVNYVNGQRQGNDPYSNTYNPGWRNHPNFSWRDNSGQANGNPNMGGANFQGGNHGPQTKATSTTTDHNTHPVFKIGMRMRGEKLTSLLRNGKELDDPHASKEKAIDLTTGTNEEEVTELPYVKPPPPPPFVPKVPFPGRLKKTRDNQKFHKFLEIFKKLQINISFADALREMPQYAKFLKEIITKKRSWDDKGTVSLTENCSSLILSDLPTKLKDPGRIFLVIKH
ncbi:uncharacterized protein LOC126681820 [Mercurialis annua]|uniref:uncharacterized protein LOC126681820 n=1 Tax=Mercurialis annua TaxID=3986 RepID=UPI00215E3FA8|nr:uncharacterized protein LOC126681820 [Mercurialis annua]